MNSSINLHKLPLLKEMFAFLHGGKHINRFTDHQLWAELERERDSYEALFKALGSNLKIDDRGFAWFQIDDATSNVSKATRQLALLFMLIFELKADTGFQLGRFTEWAINGDLLNTLIEKNRQLLDAEGLAELELLEQLLKTATNFGFTTIEGSHWKLLPAVFRYLDRFEELARSSDSADEEIEQSEESTEESQ